MAGRGPCLEEILDVMGAVWPQEAVDITTRHERIAPSAMGLKPAQPSGTPILLAANSGAGLDRIADRGDGWLPFGLPLDDVAAGWTRIQRRAAEHGRNQRRLQLVVRADPHCHDFRFRAAGVAAGFGRRDCSGGPASMAAVTTHSEPTVTEMRLVVTTDDYDEALGFYRDVLGLPELAVFKSPGGRVALLGAGRATLELTDTANAQYVDEVEVGRRIAGPIRVAFEVLDTDAMTRRVAIAGATVLAGPMPTPWGSLNTRLEAPAGLQLTLFSGEADLEPTLESPVEAP